jgi:hypothetical protein
MKQWGLIGILVAGLLAGSCGTDNKQNEDNGNNDFYNQFITSDNGIGNGREVRATNLQFSSGQVFINGADRIVNDWQLDLDKDGTFYVYTDINAVNQGANDAPLLYGKGGKWTKAGGILTLEGVGRSQTAALNSVNNNNVFTFDMCSQAQRQSGCMNVFIDQQIELSQNVQGSFSGFAGGRMYIPGNACYQVCRR